MRNYVATLFRRKTAERIDKRTELAIPLRRNAYTRRPSVACRVAANRDLGNKLKVRVCV